VITPSQYTAFITTVDTTVGAIYSQIGPGETSREWSSDLSITGSIWTTGWTGRMPKARPWYGSRVVHEPAAQTYSVEPIPYELTYGIDRFKFDDSAVNTTSIFWRELPDMARAWRYQREWELRDLLEASGVQGTTARQAGMDGLSAFNTAHPIDIYNPGFNSGNALFSAGTYCNDFSNGGQTINGTLIGGGLSQTALDTLVSYVKMIPDESGEVLGVMPDVLMVPTPLETIARIILQATFWAPPTWGGFQTLSSQVGAADNMMRKMGIRPLTNPNLRNNKRWYLMDASHTVKPTIWLTREAPRTVPRIQENDPIVFDTHRYTWGGWDRVTPAWGYSWLLFRSAPTGF
jgi:phage major head subunit gpT-like protein